MKKILCALLSLSMLVCSMTACSSADKESADSAGSAVTEERKLGIDGYVYNGEAYTYTFNKNWKCLDNVAVFDSIINYKISEEEVNNAISIGFQVFENEEAMTKQEKAEALLNAYEPIEECTIEKHGETTFNGYEAYQIIITYDQSDMILKMSQTIFERNGKLYTILTTIDEKEYDAIIDEVNEITGTFRFVD